MVAAPETLLPFESSVAAAMSVAAVLDKSEPSADGDEPPPQADSSKKDRQTGAARILFILIIISDTKGLVSVRDE